MSQSNIRSYFDGCKRKTNKVLEREKSRPRLAEVENDKENEVVEM